MWKKSLDFVENFPGFTPVFPGSHGYGAVSGRRTGSRKEGIPPAGMEYLQEVRVFPGSIHILSTCGNGVWQRL